MIDTESHVLYADCIARHIHKKHPRDSLEDLVGDARLGLCEAAGRYDAQRNDSFRGYAYRRIHGACIDGMRKRYDTTEELVLVPGRLDDAYDTVEMKQDLGTLEDKERQVLQWFYYEGLPVKDIGKRIGVSGTRVSQIMSAARDKLRKRMA